MLLLRNIRANAVSFNLRRGGEDWNMELPEKVQIGCHSISVRRKESLVDHAEACGIFDAEDLAIYLDSKLKGSLLWETYFHEIIEAINHFTEMELEHRTIQTMGVLLSQAIQSTFDFSYDEDQ